MFEIKHVTVIFTSFSKRMLYWTNWNMDRPTIERSRLDGTQRDIIVSKDLLMPHGLGLDIPEQKIYWANNLRFSSFQIERSSVDGSNRELVYHGKSHEGKGQFIYGLTVLLLKFRFRMFFIIKSNL